jgi:UDP-N-acetyl-D-mannosaminuronic acid dehydrogenase
MERKICVMGLGYIGLPTAAMLANHGHQVIGVDINSQVIEAINRGQIIIEEPQLDILVQKAVNSGKLVAQNIPDEADAFIVAVPTPLKSDKSADMSHVIHAMSALIPFLRKGNIVVLESTSPVGTTSGLILPLLAQTGLVPGEELYLAHCPERVLPGRILIEIVENNRIIGGINKLSAEKAREIYQDFVKGNIYLTDASTAELCKLMENTFRDVNIALANELAILCEHLGINVWDVIDLCNKHPRVCIHHPGPGVGGHCLAVDPYFIVEKAPDIAKIIATARNINDNMPHYLADRIFKILEKSENPSKVTIFGATYKANIDDTRESPILALISLLDEKQVNVSLFDPHLWTGPHLEEDLKEAVSKSDLLILAVDHYQFNELPFSEMKEWMRRPVVLDTRNFWDRKVLENLGYTYLLLGMGASMEFN